MQVRKFEAKSMKEALDMVKSQMGPDAIILAAKDNGRRFGLGDQTSVEITAAVAEGTLQKKKFAESRIRTEEKERIQKAPAHMQRKFINGMVGKYTTGDKPAAKISPKKDITQTKYIDIDDRENDNSLLDSAVFSEKANERIKIAAQRAWDAMQVENTWRGESGATSSASATESNIVGGKEIFSLRQELAQLKSALKQFQAIPQTMVNHHPSSGYGLGYEFAPMFEKLLQAGMEESIIAEILIEAQKVMPPIRFKNKALIEGWVAKYILDSTQIVGEVQGTKIQIFMGPPGSGKTSSVVKLASHYAVNSRKKVALITTDIMKMGAAEQLKIYAQILNSPFAVIRNHQDWDYVIHNLFDYDYIICDTPGLGMKTIEEIQLLKCFVPKDSSIVTRHLVLSATSKDQDLCEMGRRFQAVHFNDVIFTSLDNSVQHGPIYNFTYRHKTPLHSFGIGPRVPEDFEMATKERVLDLIFKLTTFQKLNGKKEL